MKIRNIIPAASLLCALSATCAADKIDDPLGLSTHSVYSNTSFVTLYDTQTLEYEAPSSESQRLSTMVGATYCARTGVTARMESEKSRIDTVVFDWCNRELFSPYGLSAYGSSSVGFSVHDDAMIDLGFIPDSSLLADDAVWNISLSDADGAVIGTLDEGSDAFLLQAGGEYSIEFSMVGSDTRTLDGATIEWGVQMAYSSSPAVVPGAGGLALCLGFGGRRRRRRI